MIQVPHQSGAYRLSEFPPEQNEPEGLTDNYYPPGSYTVTPDSFNDDSSIEES